MITRQMLRPLAILMAVPLLGAGCGSSSPTSPTANTVTATLITSTFTGALSQNGAITHNFTTVFSGAVAVTIKGITPDATVVIGLGVGNWDSTNQTCTLVLTNDSATVGTKVSGSASALSPVCVRVYDVGNVPADTPASYSLEVTHY